MYLAYHRADSKFGTYESVLSIPPPLNALKRPHATFLHLGFTSTSYSKQAHLISNASAPFEFCSSSGPGDAWDMVWQPHLDVFPHHFMVVCKPDESVHQHWAITNLLFVLAFHRSWHRDLSCLQISPAHHGSGTASSRLLKTSEISTSTTSWLN